MFPDVVKSSSTNKQVYLLQLTIRRPWQRQWRDSQVRQIYAHDMLKLRDAYSQRTFLPTLSVGRSSTSIDIFSKRHDLDLWVPDLRVRIRLQQVKRSLAVLFIFERKPRVCFAHDGLGAAATPRGQGSNRKKILSD